MNELPLSKFAPFNKQEALFQWEIHNKLKDLNVECSNCIYLGESFQPDTESNCDYYVCNILATENQLVQGCSFCKFFTAVNEIEDDNTNKEYNESSTEEMSLAIQKLDFTNSDITNKINELRNNIINE